MYESKRATIEKKTKNYFPYSKIFQSYLNNSKRTKSRRNHQLNRECVTVHGDEYI